MRIRADNYKEFEYENENARIMMQHIIKMCPTISVTIFDEAVISEELTLNLWRAVSGQKSYMHHNSICS